MTLDSLVAQLIALTLDGHGGKEVRLINDGMHYIVSDVSIDDERNSGVEYVRLD